MQIHDIDPFDCDGEAFGSIVPSPFIEKGLVRIPEYIPFSSIFLLESLPHKCRDTETLSHIFTVVSHELW